MARSYAIAYHVAALVILLILGSGFSWAQQPVSDDGSTQKGGSDVPNSITLRSTVEDWSEITLDKSELSMRPPTPGEFDNLETYSRERWQVQWRDLDPIDLYIIKPKGVEKPPVVFYLYSTEVASKQPFINDGWCQRVTRGGFAAVAFVPALTEDRFQMRPMKQWFLSELQEALGDTTHDVQMVLNLLEVRKDFDLSRVGIFGVGSGATVGILAAAADPRIKVLDLINPWGDWPKWLESTDLLRPIERKDFLTPEFLAKAAPLDPMKWLPKLTSQQIRIQIIDESTKQQKEAMDQLENAAPRNAKVVHFETVALHERATTQGGSFQWVKEKLQAGEPPSTSTSVVEVGESSNPGKP